MAKTTWCNARIALIELGFKDTPDYIFISKSNEVLRKTWESDAWYWPYDKEKPSWLKLLAAERRAILKRRKNDSIDALQIEAKRRIRDAFDLESFDDTSERQRIHSKYLLIKAQIEAVSTEIELENIDIKRHTLWGEK